MMNILTLNVHGWLEEASYEKLSHLAERIHQAQYDVVMLQEVNQLMGGPEVSHDLFCSLQRDEQAVPLKENNYALVLVKMLEDLGSSYYFTWGANHIGYDKYDEGLAILAKQPLQAKSYIVSESSAYDDIATRTNLKATVQLDGQDWTVVTGHFSWWQSDAGELLFKHEWKNALAHMEEVDRSRLIVAGDFNNHSLVRGEGYDFIRETAPFLVDTYQVADVRRGFATAQGSIDGWAHQTSDKRIDYIFVSKEINVVSSRVIFDGEHAPVVSDHFGIEVVLDNK